MRAKLDSYHLIMHLLKMEHSELEELTAISNDDWQDAFAAKMLEYFMGELKVNRFMTFNKEELKEGELPTEFEYESNLKIPASFF